MKKLLLLLLIPFLGMATTLKADNVLSMGDYQGDPGDVITVSVNMANDQNDIAGFQFDIPMNGFSYVNGSAVKSNRLPGQFILIAQTVSNGNLRVLCYSMPGTNIPGNDGDIMTFQITLGDAEGIFPLEFEDIVLSNIQGGTIEAIGVNGSVVIGNPATTYDITLSANPSNGGAVSGAGTYNAGEEVTVTATPFDGYSFVNWTENGTEVSSNAAYTFTVMSDRYLVANFEENIVYYTLTLIANPTDGGTLTGAGTYEAGTSVTVTATAAAGYEFNNWTENGSVVSTSDSYTFTISGDRTLVANFNVVIPSLNILSIGDYTAMSGAETTISVNLNNSDDVVAFQLDIPLDASLSYVAGSAALTPRATANHFMSAQIVSNNTLRFIVYSMPSTPFIGENGAIVTFDITGSVAGTYALNMTNAILSDAQGQSLLTEVVNGSIEILPLPTYTINAGVYPEGAGTVTGAGVYEEGETATLTATAIGAYTFDNWTEGGDVVSTDATYSFVVTEDRNLVANFTAPSMNILSIGDYTGAEGDVLTIDINLENEDEVSGFQFDIPLNEGFTYVDGSLVKGVRCSPYHIIIGQLVDNGTTFRVLCYSMPPANISGNDGAIASLQILLGEEGTYDLGLAGCVLSTMSGGILPVIANGGTLTVTGGQPVTYTVTATVNPVGSGTVTGAGVYEEGETATLVATPVSGYDFVNWTEGGDVVSTDATYSFVVTEDRDLVANFTAPSTNILSIADYTGAEGDILTIDINLANEDAVSGFQFDIPLNEGFTYVEGSLVKGQRCSPYHIILGQLVDNGTILRVLCYAMPPANISGNDGAIASIQIILGEAGTYDLGLANCVLSTMNGGTLPVIGIGGTLTVTGGPTVTYNITATVNPAGAGTVTGAGEYEEGAIATLVATANSGYEFVNWTENGTEVSTNATYSFVVTEDRALVANFVVPVVYYTITATVNPVGAGTVTGAGVYEEGTTATVAATALAGFYFVNWTENGTVVSTSETYSFVVNGDRDLVANFAQFEGNYLSIGNYNGVYNQTITAGVNLTNGDEVAGLQMDIPLDDNFTYAEGTIALTDRASANHVIYAGMISNHVLRVIVYSMPSTPFIGTTGEIFTFGLTLGTESGIFPLPIENAIISDVNGNSLPVETSNGSVTVVEPEMFEITATTVPNAAAVIEGVGIHAEQSTATLTAIANPGYEFVNWTENGEVISTEETISFVVLSDRHFVVNFNVTASNILSIGDESGFINTNTTIGVNMDNVEEVSGLQFDVILPEGITYVAGSAALTDRASANHILVAGMIDPVTLRVLAYAMPSGNFSGTTGDVVTFQVTGSEEGIYALPLGNPALSNYAGTLLTVGTYDGTLTLTNPIQPQTYTITATVNPVGAGTVTGAGQYEEGTTATLVATAVSGYDFVNWTEEGTVVSTNAAYTFVVTGDRDLVANFIPTSVTTYTITATANPAEGGTIAGAGVYNEGTIATLVATAASGYYFVNWTEGGDIVSTSPTYSFIVTSDRTLVANFAEATGNMLILSNESGTDGSVVTMSVDMINIEDISGFQFDIVMNEHISYVEGSAALTDRATPQHIMIAQLINGGTILRILCYSMPGANFIGNSGAIATFDLVITGEAGATYTVDLDNPVISTIQGHTPEVIAIDGSVTIVSGEFYTITATANPPEGGSVIGGGVYNPGDLVTVFAAPAEGYEFVNWTENGVVVSTTAAYSFTATSNRDLVANFIPSSVTTYTITAIANPAEGGSVAGAGVYNEGTIATLVATSASGYYFVNWTEGDLVVSTSSTYSFTVTSDRTLVANFTEASTNMLILSNESGADGSVVTMSVDMINLQEISGFQFDIMMNEHITYVEGSMALTDRATPNHILIAQLINDGTILRALCYSMPGANFEGSSGPVVTFDMVITGEEGVTYTVDLDNPVISTIQGHTPDVIAIDGSVTIIPGGYFTITTTANPAEGGSVMGGGIYYPGDVVTVYASAAEGYEFVNWTEDGVVVATTPSYSFTAASDRNLVANFTPVATDKYHIYLLCSPYQGGFAAGGGVYTFGEEITVTATPNTGYTFYSWTEDGSVVSYSSAYSFVVTADRTLTAVFQPKNYTVTATANPTQGGTVTGSGMYPYGNIATVTAAPHTGYNFVSWSINGEVVSLDPSYSFPVFSDVFVTGNFEKKNMSVALNALPVNAAATLTGAGVYKYGANVTISTSPVTGYDFINWTEYGTVVSTNATYTFTITDNHSFIANFGLQSFNVTTSVVPAAGGSATGAGTYYYNQVVTLFAAPNTGYSFLNWSVNGTVVSTQPQYIFQVTQDMSFVATFELNTYYVSINVTPYNGGTVSGEGYYDHGTRVTLQATPNENYRFVEWLVNNESVSTSATYTFTISEDMRFVAVFSYDLGIDPNSSLNASVYPNPTTDIVNAKCEGMKSIMILTNNGEKVNSISEINADECSVDLTQFGSGTYIIRIETTYGIITKKVVKM